MFIGVYWGPRKEGRNECAERICEFFIRLRQLHPVFMAWYSKGRSSKTIKQPLDLSKEQIGRILKTNNRDSDDSAISELGFNIGVWNGEPERAVSFNATSGAYSDIVNNYAVLEFDSNWDAAGVLTQNRLRDVLETLVELFDPERGLVTNHDYFNEAGDGAPWTTRGWLVYERICGDSIVE